MIGKRIIIIGCCGSGKSTLATKLNRKFNIPVVHLDRLFWRSDWKSVSQEEFERLLTVELQKDCWIIDGNYIRTLQQRLDYCDTVIYLDYNRLRCIYGVIKRVLKNHGKTRADMGENCPEKFDFAFLKYTWDFNKNFRNEMYTLLKKYKDKQLYILKSQKQCNQFINQLEKFD